MRIVTDKSGSSRPFEILKFPRNSLPPFHRNFTVRKTVIRIFSLERLGSTRGKIRRLLYDAAQLLWFYFNTSDDQHRGLRHFIFDLLIRGITRFRESATFLELSTSGLTRGNANSLGPLLGKMGKKGGQSWVWDDSKFGLARRYIFEHGGCNRISNESQRGEGKRPFRIGRFILAVNESERNMPSRAIISLSRGKSGNLSR